MSSSAVLTSVRRLRGLLAVQHCSEESDEQLLDTFLAHRDESAFAALVHRHGPMVLHVCRRVLGHQQDAEDAFQATFLVLARRAGVLRKKSSLAGFLYGTAYRIALKAQQSAARRRKHEGRAPSRQAIDPLDELSWREVRALLDEEIARLPEIYRSVFVICCLQGVNRAEAARRLRLKEGTVASRLAKARERLQQRLSRRGVELTAVLAAIAATTPSASALPVGLAAATTKVAQAMIVDGATALTPTVAALVQTGSPILSLGRIKIAVLILLTVAASGSLMGWYGRASGPLAATIEPPAANANGKSAASPPRQMAKDRQIHGRVLAPDGKPKAGAKLLLLDQGKLSELGISAADGTFTIALAKGRKYRPYRDYLIARAEGLGLDFLGLSEEMSVTPVELHLVKDNAIRGRIVSTEGKPIRGVRVSAHDIAIHINHSLDTFLEARLKILAGGKGEARLKTLWGPEDGLFAVVTDADGRFVLRGIGAERTTYLRLKGGGIAESSVRVVNRSGFDPKPYNQAYRDFFVRVNRRKDQPGLKKHFLFGPVVSLIAESEKVIRGVVRDSDTGRGVPNLAIHLSGNSDGLMSVIALQAKTDAEGRYEIHGVHKAKRYLIQFLGDAVAGYTPSQIWADDTAGYQPVSADLKVKKGVIITGKVIDRVTGKPIPGTASVAVLADNPFVKEYHYDKMFTSSPMPFIARSGELEADGTFRLVTLPGPVLLMGGPDHQMLSPVEALKYKGAVADPKYPQYFQVIPAPFAGESRLTYAGLGVFRGGVEGGFCKVLDTRPGVAVVKQDIILERARALTVNIRDADGRPLSGVWVTGISPRPRYRAIRMENDRCPVYGMEAGQPRLMVFCEPSRKLAGTLTLKGDEKSPLTVKLQTMGAITGRLIDAEGKPLVGINIDLRYRQSQVEEIHYRIHEGKQVVTDAAGMFRIEELLPELKFALSFRRGERILEREKRAGEEEFIFQVKPGEGLDLGEIRVKLP